MQQEKVNLIKPREAAQYLGVSIPLVYKLVRVGVLPCIRITQNTIRFCKTDLDAFLEKRKMNIE